MLDLANKAGKTARAGLTPDPNCSSRANIEYGVQATMNTTIIKAIIIVTFDSALLTWPPMRHAFWGREHLCHYLQEHLPTHALTCFSVLTMLM